jgi:hypothetical protein
MIIHINLISHQLIPNIIGTFSNPGKNMKVVLVLGDSSLLERAELLTRFYESKGISNVETINCQTSYDHAKIYHRAKALFEELKSHYPDAIIALNATGGTKAMSIAFTQVFDKLSANAMAFYTDTEQKQNIILTNPDENKFPPLPYKSVLDIDNYLLLNKFKVASLIDQNSLEHDNIITRRGATEYLLSICKKNKNLISVVNNLAQQSNFGHKYKPFTPEVIIEKRGKLLSNFLQKLEGFNLIALTETALTFTDEESARYIGGAWFEEYAYLCAYDAGIENFAMSVEGLWLGQDNDETTVKNELDLILIQNNHIMIVECKTCNWQQGGKGQNATLKLESLMRNLGGSHAKGMLLSVFDLDDFTHDRVQNIKGLTPFSGNNIFDLYNHISQWKSQSS